MATATTTPKRKKFTRVREAERRLRADLVNGLYPPGSCFKATPASRRYGIGTIAIARFLKELAEEGLLEKKQWRDRATYYIPGVRVPNLSEVAEAKASVALDGETQPYGEVGKPSNRPDTRTRYQVFTDWLLAELATGKYPVGTKLPSQKQLALATGETQNTVWRAMQILGGSGFVRGSAGGKGTVVIALPPQPAASNPSPEESTVEMAQSFVDTAVEQGIPPQGSAPRPITDQPKRPTVREQITAEILDGTYPTESVMPSPAVMANRMGVTRQGVDQVYRALTIHGLLYKEGESAWVVVPEDQRPAAFLNQPQDAEAADQEDQEGGDGKWVRADEVMPMLKVLYEENRRLSQAESLAEKAVERMSGFEAEIVRLRGEVAEWRGKFNRKEEENADLRGKLHRQNQNGAGRKVIATFGPEFRNTLGMSEADAARIKRLMETARER